MEMDNQLMAQAIEVFGKKNQTDMILEECLELGFSIAKLKRGETEDRNFNFLDELADMNIMIAQANLMVEKNTLQSQIEFKQNRLRLRILEKQKGIVSHSEVE